MEATSTKTEAVDRRAGTSSVALRLLRLCGKGEARSSALGLALLFFSTAAALLQPWPMKLVIDSVIGSNPAPAFLSKSAHAISASDPRIALLVLLCVAQLLLHMLIGALMVASTYVLVAVGLRMVFRLRCALFDWNRDSAGEQGLGGRRCKRGSVRSAGAAGGQAGSAND